jgi:hypothetical protein
MQLTWLFLSSLIQNLSRILLSVASLMPHPLLLLTHNNGRNPYYDERKARAIEMPVATRSAAMDSSIRALVAIRRLRDMNGLRRVASILSCLLNESTLDLAVLISLVSAALEHDPLRHWKSCNLQPLSRGEMAMESQSRPRSSYCRAESLRPPVQLGPH